MAQPVVHFEICGADAAKARAFYAKLFEWEISMWEGQDYGLVAKTGDNSIGGGVGPLMPGQQPSILIYIQVDDLQKYLDKATALGGKTIHPPSPIPGIGSFALFADPNGVTVGLFKPQT
ncbi:MAG: VOC family protein [Candidatus Zixiibacteriota bacterium]